MKPILTIILLLIGALNTYPIPHTPLPLGGGREGAPITHTLLPLGGGWEGALVATDALGRTLPSAVDFPLKTDGKPRTVGIFYITWHTQNLHNSGEYRADVSRVLDGDPNARLQWDNPQWTGPSYHWGEPEYGYFLSQDKYVIRHDMSMLADAGVDVIILDVTNAVCYWDEWEVILQTMEEMKAEGNKVPRFCFWAFNGNVITVVQSLYERFYKEPRYQDLWFYWGDKPLLLYNEWPSVDANPNGGEKNLADYSQEVKDFFTLRCMWWGYWKWAGQRYVGTEDHWSFGFDLGDKDVVRLSPEELCAKHQGRMEQMAVTPAQHPVSIIGKSWRRQTGEPELDDHDMPSRAYIPYLDEERDQPTQYGIYFQDRWDEALQVDPDFIYLNDWNEWTAGRYRQGKDPSGQADLHIDFLGRKDNPFYFVDQYNAEFNRTIAPMKGGWTDNYYMQMVQNIRRYKGVAPTPVFHGYSTVTVDGDLSEWTLSDDFRDTRGDVIHRDHDGYGNLHYTDTTGRNDILDCHVSVSPESINFAVRTASELTPDTDPNWMLLFIDADQNAKTGWEGYDYMVSQGNLLHWENGEWSRMFITHLGRKGRRDSLPVVMAHRGNTLEVSISRMALDMRGKSINFDFKWADNPSDLSSIISLCTTGDAAPNRRFNYRYQWTEKAPKAGEKDGMLRIAQLTDIHLNAKQPERRQALQRMIAQLNAQDDIDLVLITGDITDDGDLQNIQATRKVLSQLRHPYRVVMGNHETKWSESGCTAWSEVFGYERFELNVKGVRLLGFNTGPLMRMAYGHVTAQDLKWLKQRLDSYPKDAPVIIVTHYPLLKGDVDNWYEVTDLLRQYNVRLCIGGHYHSLNNLSYDGIPGVLMRACVPDDNGHSAYGLYTIDADSILCQCIEEGSSPIRVASYPMRGAIRDKDGHILNPRAGAFEYPDSSDNVKYNNVSRVWTRSNFASIYSSPVTDGEHVIVGDDAGFVRCLSLADGSPQWAYGMYSRIVGTPAVAEGIVVAGAANGWIRGFSATDGTCLWKLRAKGPVLGAVSIVDGVAYIGASDHCMRAIDIRSGKVLWTFGKVDGYIETKPLVTEAQVIFGAWDGHLYCLDRQNGKLLWTWYNGLEDMHYSPAAVWPVSADGKVFIVDPERAMTAISLKSGKTVWRTKQSKVRESLGISADGQKVYGKTMQDSLVCYSTQGSEPHELWACNVGFGYEHGTSMPQERDGVVYGGTVNGGIYAVEASTGRLLWRHQVGSCLVNTVLPIGDGRVLYTSTDGSIGCAEVKN